MPLIRIVEGDHVIGNIEAETVPAVGDTFWWETNGPYEVLSRTWHFPPGYNEERPQAATLQVKEMTKGKARIRST